MIDVATRSAVAKLMDERFRASYVLANHGFVMPTTHGNDELLPFWKRGDERPSDAESLKRSRGRGPGEDDAPFVPQDIPGSSSQLGCGYLGFKIASGGSPSTAQPGSVGGDKDVALNLELWIYTPTTRDTEIGDFYTDAFREVWSTTTMTVDRFASFFPSGGGIHWIEQVQPIEPAQERRETKTYRERLLIIPLLRRQSAVLN